MKHVPFVRNHNVGLMAPPDVVAESAGQEPRSSVSPEVVEVMREVGSPYVPTIVPDPAGRSIDEVRERIEQGALAQPSTRR